MPYISPQVSDRAARPTLFAVGALFAPLGGKLALDGHAFGFAFAGMGLLFLVGWWFRHPAQPNARARRAQRWERVLSLVCVALGITAAVLFLRTGASRPTATRSAAAIGAGVLAVAALVARAVVGRSRAALSGRRS